MEKAGINDLPRYSRWPARLLGVENFPFEERTLEKLLREYNNEKYPNLLHYVKEHPQASFDEVRRIELGLADSCEMIISRNGELFRADAEEAFSERRRVYQEHLMKAASDVDAVVELGAGYGYNLSLIREVFPNLRCCGGEIAASAIELTKHLPDRGIRFEPFDLFSTSWQLLDRVEGDRLLIVTSHAAEMMKEFREFIDNLFPYKERIVRVVHFEPLFERNSRETLLGLLRAKYILANDYNQDLYGTLSADARVEIEHLEDDLFGLNPLFPESFLSWHFV